MVTSGAADSHSLDVSVVIPCLNEEGTVGSCVDAARAAFAEARVSGEVVVADNGSTDGTREMARRHGARIVCAERRGYGNTLREGIEAARGSFIVFADGDGSYDLSEVPKFVEKWREGFDVVMGNRFGGEIKPGAMPWHHRYFGNPVLSGILRALFRAPVHDAHCGMRGFTKAVYERMDLRTTGMEFASEFVIKATRLECRMTEIPITLWPDKRGRPPHLRSVPDGWRHLRFMLLYSPNWLFMGPGLALSVIGTGLVVWLLPGPRKVGNIVFDIHTMLFGMVFVLVGVQIISIGLFARVFSYSERFDRSNRSLETALKGISLERGLLLGLVLTLVGLGGDVWVFWRWQASGFGPLSQVRPVIFWSLIFFVGVQVIFSSFFLSMLGISRDTYIGDYDTKQVISAGREPRQHEGPRVRRPPPSG